MDIEGIINQRVEDSIKVKRKMLEQCMDDIKNAAILAVATLRNGNKVMICGNGGSAADAQHFAAELVMRFETTRASLPAIALTTDSSLLTSIANDLAYKEVFARQVAGLGNKNDLLFGISTSGNSENILRAMEEAQNKQMQIIALCGNQGGRMKHLQNNTSICVPASSTARIQEAHIMIIHILCEIIDSEFT